MRSRGRPPVEHADISERVTRGAGRGARGERASARTVYLKDHVLHADKLLAAGHLLELLGREREWARQHGGHLRQQTRSATGSARRAARGGQRAADTPRRQDSSASSWCRHWTARSVRGTASYAHRGTMSSCCSVEDEVSPVGPKHFFRWNIYGLGRPLRSVQTVSVWTDRCGLGVTVWTGCFQIPVICTQL